MVPRNSEIHSSQHAGRARKSWGAPSTSSKPWSIGAISRPMRPMSWYSGSQDTARSACGELRAGDDGVEVRPDAAVGEHHALGRRGRPARELQDGEAVGIVGRAFPCRRADLRTLDRELVEQDHCRVLGRRFEERCEVTVDHHERGVGAGDASTGLLDELLDRTQAHREGERDQRAAGEVDRLDGGDELSRRRAEHAHVHAGARRRAPAGLRPCPGHPGGDGPTRRGRRGRRHRRRRRRR